MEWTRREGKPGKPPGLCDEDRSGYNCASNGSPSCGSPLNKGNDEPAPLLFCSPPLSCGRCRLGVPAIASRNTDVISQDQTPAAAAPRAWVLLSGGIDSVACLAFHVRQGFRVTCLHVDLGQPGSALEHAAAERAALHYAVPMTTLRWTGSADFTGPEIVGRNAFLLMGALMEIGDRPGLLATGIHSGTRYFDCKPEFLFAIQTIVDGYCDGRVKVVAPFLQWSKQEVFAFCMSESVPITLTYSCERGAWPPCRKCTSCLDRSSVDAL